MFANSPGDLGSIPGRVIPKTQKMVLDASLLNTQYYKVRIKGKVEQSREGVAPSPTPWCSSYRKGSLRVTLDYGRQLYLLLLIYIYKLADRCQWRPEGSLFNSDYTKVKGRALLLPLDYSSSPWSVPNNIITTFGSLVWFKLGLNPNDFVS